MRSQQIVYFYFFLVIFRIIISFCVFYSSFYQILLKMMMFGYRILFISFFLIKKFSHFSYNLIIRLNFSFFHFFFVKYFFYFILFCHVIKTLFNFILSLKLFILIGIYKNVNICHFILYFFSYFSYAFHWFIIFRFKTTFFNRLLVG